MYTMSMNIEEIIREYIGKSIHMSLGTSRDNKPWVCEVHFVYDQDLNLYFRSLASRRHSEEIAANPFVSGNIVKQHVAGEYPHGIYFEGSAEMMESEEERRKVFHLFTEQGVPEAALADAAKEDGHKFYKITVGNWFAFGKFSGDKGQKYTLPWHGGKV
jgi:uncharacterized protein YhbP (UPF0306 family)